ncbi:hypothetical protein P1T45_04245 [Streptococcus parauberis]|uniref:hypothetical protein n=1 Tax=Streptococcus parauberis TaxID=1348 RepID=UPI00280B8F5F|nr:hypothetical protein [Streptococcus parauberis]WEM65824.1 hypothetical protein P1T45_04245 [Streptococcus parauberis]
MGQFASRKRADNNWGGLTWTGSGNRPSGIKVTQGTARPANEGGYYMHFASVSDYFKDYTYLLAEQGIYKVKGANNIDAYTKGLFRVGGAAYDYAAAGYGHYAPLMRSIRNGINSASNGAMDTLDNQFKTAGTVGTAPVSQIATKTKDALAQLGAIKGQRVGSGQCYALSALYSLKLGGAGLGGGVTGFRGLRPGGGAAASQIGEDYNWSQFGWKVVRPSEVKHLIPGSIANIRANAGGPVFTGGWGHTVVIKGLSGDTLTVYEQNYAGHQFVEERTYSASAYLRVIQTLVYPPEIVQGKRIDGTESAPTQSGTTGNNEPKTISETQQQEKTVGIPTDLYREWKNEDGVVEFYIKNGSIYAPISKELYPSVFTGEEISDNWIKKSVEYQTIDIEQIISYSLEELKKHCYPEISYVVDGYTGDLDIGDTVVVEDEEFPDELFLEARVTEQHISFTNPSQNKTVFDNFKALENKLNSSLIDRYEELAEQAKPFELRLLTDKGTQFKNSTGLSVLTAELWKNNKQYDATFQFRNFDTLLASGLSYTADGSTVPIDKPFLVSIDAFIGNDLVATRQITFTNVSDGTDGIGINSTSVTYGLSNSADTQPTSWSDKLPSAGEGQYLWTRKITDYTDDAKEDTIEYTYSYQGKTGVAGTSIKVSKIEYQIGTSGTVAPSGAWLTTIPSVPDGQFLWSKTTMSDNSIIYGISKQGADGKTQYTHIAYANIEFLCKERGNFTLSEVSLVRYGSDSRWVYKEFQAGTYTATTNLWGSDPASGTTKNVELVSEFSTSNSIDTTYIGIYVDFVESDSVDPSKYNWTLVKGADGTQGTPGTPGADGKTPYFHTAWSNNADGTLDFNPDYKSAVGLDILNFTSWAKNTSMSSSTYNFVGNADRSFKVTGKGTGGYEVLSKSFPAKVGDKLRFTVRYTNRLAFALYNNYGLQFVVNNAYTESVTSTSKIVLPNAITASTEYQLEYTATTSNVWMQLNFGGVADSAQVDFDIEIEVENLTSPVKYAYMGTYSDYTANDSTVPTDYIWSRILGEDGAKGDKGALDEEQVKEITDKIDTKSDSELTQEQLNLLLETQNLMTAEMRTKATAEEVDALIASYNKYVSDESVNKANVEAELIANAERIEAFRKDYDDKMLQLDFVSNYMRATDLGLEVSASDGSSSLLIQKDRISMFSAGKEVMYISQGLIHIDNGVFTKTLQIGNFRESQADGDPTTNLEIYVG